MGLQRFKAGAPPIGLRFFKPVIQSLICKLT